MRFTTMMALSLLLLGACESDEERCNEARVTAHEAWGAVQSALSPQCGVFEDRFWTRVSEVASQGVGAMAMGSMTREESESMSVELAVEEYKSKLTSACGAVRRAKDTATAGALAAQEAADPARDAVQAVEGAHSEVLAALQGNAARGAIQADAAQRFQVHSQALAQAGLEGLVQAAQPASAASFEACRTVDP